MKARQSIYLLCGFLAGIVYVSCGGAAGVPNAVADAIGSALDVTFANEDSGLTGTTVQAAIDELDGKVDTLETNHGTDISSLLEGTWTGTVYFNDNCTLAECSATDVSLTLSSDNSYTCSGTSLSNNNRSLSGSNTVCSSASSWEVLTRSLLLHYNNGSNDVFKVLQINFISSTKIELHDSSIGETYVLTKN